MIAYGNLNYKSMTKDELYDLMVADFDKVRPEIKECTFRHFKHHTFEEWKALLKLALDDLIANYSVLIETDAEVIRRLNSQHFIAIPRELKYHLEQYGLHHSS